MPRVTQLRIFPRALLRQPRTPILRRFMRRVGPLLSVKVHREVATAALRRLAVSILALETRGSRPGLQQRFIHGGVARHSANASPVSSKSVGRMHPLSRIISTNRFSAVCLGLSG
jgi:hypothetical protein